jgi:xanthine dehydrogenase accessory factor
VHQADIGKDRSGMICSGEQTVSGYFLYGQEAFDLVSNIIAAFDERDKPRELEFSSAGIRLIPAGERRVLGPDEWCYYEVLHDQPRIAIIGAGHVSLALSQQMDLLGFHVTVYDDRKGLHTWHANTFAQQKHVVDYARMFEHLPDDPELYVVIASVGYRTDDLILRQLVHHRYKYLGLLGSTEKVRVMFDAMRKDGFPDEVLQRVHAPIGLPIHSRTPEEIAVSIAAEIVGVKNR